MESKNAVENKPKTVTFGDKTLVKQIETRREEQRLKEAQRKSIHESICELIEDEITEEILRKNLQILDAPSWQEVVEERFLGRLCGYPLCSKEIAVDFRKEFNIRDNKLLKTDSEQLKYCSTRCLNFSNAIYRQLDLELDLKSRLETGSHKKFVIPTEDEAVVSSTLENGGKNQNEEEHGIPTLVKSLVNLKVADNSPEDDNDSGSNRSDSDEEDEREFLNQIKGFISSKKSINKKVIASSNSSQSAFSMANKSDNKGPPIKSDENGNKSLSDVSARIKAKYEAENETYQQRKPAIIEPRNLNVFADSGEKK